MQKAVKGMGIKYLRENFKSAKMFEMGAGKTSSIIKMFEHIL